MSIKTRSTSRKSSGPCAPATRYVSWVMVNTKTRSKNDSIVETRISSLGSVVCIFILYLSSKPYSIEWSVVCTSYVTHASFGKRTVPLSFPNGVKHHLAGFGQREFYGHYAAQRTRLRSRSNLARP